MAAEDEPVRPERVGLRALPDYPHRADSGIETAFRKVVAVQVERPIVHFGVEHGHVGVAGDDSRFADQPVYTLYGIVRISCRRRCTCANIHASRDTASHSRSAATTGVRQGAVSAVNGTNKESE